MFEPIAILVPRTTNTLYLKLGKFHFKNNKSQQTVHISLKNINIYCYKTS